MVLRSIFCQRLHYLSKDSQFQCVLASQCDAVTCGEGQLQTVLATTNRRGSIVTTYGDGFAVGKRGFNPMLSCINSYV